MAYLNISANVRNRERLAVSVVAKLAVAVVRLQVKALCHTQASGYRLQASGMGLSVVTGSITKWSPNPTLLKHAQGEITRHSKFGQHSKPKNEFTDPRNQKRHVCTNVHLRDSIYAYYV